MDRFNFGKVGILSSWGLSQQKRLRRNQYEQPCGAWFLKFKESLDKQLVRQDLASGVTMHGTQPGWKFVAGAPRHVNPKAHPPHTGNNRDNRGENECLLFSLELGIKISFQRT